MSRSTDALAAIQGCVVNRLDPSAAQADRIAGIIGDRPSLYAKSPSLWNAVFRRLELNCTYLAFDVDEGALEGLVRTLRRTESLLGCNVTVPYKVKVIPYLDAVDDKARHIGAVNTIVRTRDGRLVGYNTDGSGFIWSLTMPLLPGQEPLLPDPKGLDALVIGAGGAARAVAFYLAEVIGNGRLLIANRTAEAATALAEQVNRLYGNARAFGETEIAGLARSVGLVVNCSTRGQAGLRKLPGGQVTMLEPYSALAPASPAALPESSDFAHRWFEASLPDIERNNHLSATTVLDMPPSVAAYDLVYAPLETVFLRHCRLTGHRTANGKGMNIGQAVEALFDRVCAAYFQELGLADPATRRRIVDVMCEVW